ncbi:CsbD family protein [Tahibacter amnicola]|uniref:CsbD family protein n=1 Tax=Tahibacter amnicola TaxID=2976241 RepID=A0ABY6BFK5_9GAMM|nr:CsbD family protein [Tahibacter amnicola]MCU7376391.1 CsbD family protein [Paucibacter sp. O1-1]MDA3831408.1 CsbD family protein [Paucibacter sp. O1-1]UXI68302.1 CsbD family protein [Tahibacter amnicola]
MNNDIIEGKWKQIAGRVKTTWNKLTDDDLGVAEGHRDYLIGKLQERYGWAKDQAESEVRKFEQAL